MDYLVAKSRFGVSNLFIYYYQRRHDFQRINRQCGNQQFNHRPDNTGRWQIYQFDSLKRYWWGYVLTELEIIGDTPTREQIDRLQTEMVKMPQVELQTEHYFVPGMYCRRVYRPAGTLIVGKVHKHPHFFLCAKGEIIAWTEKGMKKLQAGDVVECQPGTKRVTLATQDSIGVTIHKTDKTDLNEIETELVEPDNTALFDSGNNLKQIIADLKKLEGE